LLGSWRGPRGQYVAEEPPISPVQPRDDTRFGNTEWCFLLPLVSPAGPAFDAPPEEEIDDDRDANRNRIKPGDSLALPPP
jgi:hypothetical protein